MDWLWTILGGLLIGVLARIFVRGRQNFGIIVTILLGIGGAAIGHWLWYTVLNREDTAGINWIQLFMSIAAAAILIGVWGAIFSKKR
ncbi:GlsB/YeaQ/YmgE family stress response membrane protein [Demequina lignilytica]|uniref:GlsB/YeaQ/YmgE family stress response membrane protein n=1 Tax=Demequina lignilytica TaxID=3051663 RepID=A0AB35MH98_9MICO|nr:GlsB/YeaQ/YmgE family stress response membrane protein [Demequina sp. SYSU T0a273]MDN4483078.1 GlsB/YeaQ/YmgE family stress response membrane protein [Demequina sp. SYSU T0a273]